MINNLLSKIIGSSLTKNYEVDKEPYLHGGMHNLWKIYRGKKKDRNNMDVSLFIFEKKSLDKKKLHQNQKDEICNILKKDPQNLAKLRHPNLLSLIEQPMEDQKFLIFVTEPVEINLASLQFDATKKDLIPGDLEIKCLGIELLEALNFLHNNAKLIHMGLAPEHVYITKDGKLKLGGLNFAQQFSTAESLNVPLNYDLKINELAVVPNLRFAAPEISESSQCSVNSDLFSVGTLLFFMQCLNKGKNPFLLNQTDITDKQSHSFECGILYKKFNQYMQGMDTEFEIILRQLTHQNGSLRGPINAVNDKSWFQDPLLKTIKYLETLDSKDHMNKVQFLQGITRILEKFDKKALLKKVIPLLLDQMKIIQLSVNVLPNILEIMERPQFLTTTEFRDYIWPNVQKLCKAKELPAQALFLILKNTELFIKFVGPSEFQSNFLILVNKSLECGVPKLQFLALTKVPLIIKQIDYGTVKQSIIPRILMILEKPGQVQLKQKTLEIMNEIIGIIDQQTMKDKILKTFDKIRASETDPQLCMLLLKIYEQMAKVLGVEEIGLKILPGIIPMLISGTFTRAQFKDMMQSVRRLLDQIEQHREKDLREMGQEGGSNPDGAFDMDALEKSLGIQKAAPSSTVTSKDVFDFLSSLEKGPSGESSSMNQNNNQASTSNTQGQQNDIFSTMNNLAQSKPQTQVDPFAGMMHQQPQSQQPQQQQIQQNLFGSGFGSQQPKQTQNSGWDAEIPNMSGGFNNQQNASSSSGQKQNEEDDFFASIAKSNQNTSSFNQPKQTLNFGSGVGGRTSNPQQQNKPVQQPPFGGSTNLGFGKGGNLNKLNDDPFAELIESSAGSQGGIMQSKPDTLGGGGLNLNFSAQSNPSSIQPQGFGNFGGMSQQTQQSQSNPLSQFGSTQSNSNNTMGAFNQPFGNNSNNQSSNNNTLSSFGNQPSSSNPAVNQMNFGNFNYGQSTTNTFGQAPLQSTNMMFNNNNNSQNTFGAQSNTNANAFGSFPMPKQQQQQQQNSGNDDFFSQFTTTTNNQQQQQQQQNTNNFGGLF